MSEATQLSSSPTKSLSSWWRNFKTGARDAEDGSDTGGSLHPLSQEQSLKRPGLNRSSASSSAVPGLSPNKASKQVHADYGIVIPPQYMESPVFGVPLNTSLRYANVKISLANNTGESFVYGHVPVIIAKCSVYLKQNARDTEGIFRIPGSVRRVRMLQELFNTPPSFGKDLDWSGFTVHDAANLLKRYLAMLPDPIIPRHKYALFREPLQTKFSDVRDYINYQASAIQPQGNRASMILTTPAGASAATASPNTPAAPITATPTSATTSEPTPPITPVPKPSEEQIEEVTSVYENLIFALPKSSQQLLLYLIDLLSVFTAQSEQTRMSAYNLAAIFQPSILTIKEHDMNPDELQTSRIVIEFLIENSVALLKRVQTKAIYIHEHGEEEEANRESDENLQDYSIAAEAPQGIVPPLTISGPGGSPDDDSSFVPTHTRRHSKSLSSANPPALQLRDPGSESPKFGFLRRQRSTRSNKSNRSRSPSEGSQNGSTNQGLLSDLGENAALEKEQHLHEPIPHRHNTRTPSGGDDERKSRFRRSLMVLLPGKDSSSNFSPGSSRNSSPSRPEMNHTHSWLSKFRSRSPDE